MLTRQAPPPQLGAAQREVRYIHVLRPDRGRIEAAVETIAQLHGRFAVQPLLGECRILGGDLGSHFFTSSVHDAKRALEATEGVVSELNRERRALVGVPP